MIEYELAQLNIALMPYPFESPYMKDFVDNLDRINLLAENSDGFVWRLQTEDENDTDILPFGDNYLVNISVWRDVDALRNFVFSPGHVEIMRRRREWFTKVKEAYAVLWWIPKGSRPTAEEAEKKLESLRQSGSTAEAFTFKSSFSPTGNPVSV